MKTAKSLSTKDLLFKYIFDKNPCIGFSVSTKYGNSVQRNLFKRRCRSVFKKVFYDSSVEISLIVKPKSKNVSYQSILKSFVIAYEKIII